MSVQEARLPDASNERTVCCLGGMTMDRVLTLQGPGQLGTVNPVSGERRAGGMARNVAAELARQSVSARLIAIVGDDQDGREIVRQAAQQGIDTGLVQKSLSRPTGTSTVVVDMEGELYAAFADMAICESMDRGFIQNRWIQISRSTLVFADASLPADSLAYLIAGCREQALPLVLDTASLASARKLPPALHGLELLVCSADEARAILGDELAKDPGSMAAALCQRGVGSTLVAADTKLTLAQADGATAQVSAGTAPFDGAAARAAFIARTLHERLRGRDWRRSVEAASM